MKKDIMLTIFSLCVILIVVGCKNGYDSIKEENSDKDADKSLNNKETLIENTSSRRNRKYRSFWRDF